MGIILSVPTIELDRVEQAVGKLIHPLAYADKIIACVTPKGVDVKEVLSKAGIPCNIAGFRNSNVTSTMWRDNVRFDATGLMIKADTWYVNNDVRDLQFSFLQKHDRTQQFSTELLMQYAVVLTGPEFCPNQVEYGKRHMLRTMLLS